MDAIIYDMDGTLCDVTDIRHYVTNGNRNFDKFHRASLFCPPNHAVWMAYYAWHYTAKKKTLIVTARERTYEKVTTDWLAKHNIEYDELYMRGFKDYRPDYVVKSEILDQIRADGYNPIMAYDDNPNVIRLWEENDIPAITIPGWEDY